MNLLSDTRMTVVFGAVVAVTAAIYVAFGPSASTETPHEVKGGRKKRKRASRGMPRGLHNSGNTCFVNAILQAVSSCPAVFLWLEEMQNQAEGDVSSIRPDLFGDLLTVLKVVNATEDYDDVANSGEVGDPEVWAPARLFRTLRTLGWVINAGEQDAHEYFQVLFTTLEEELQERQPQQNTPASLLDSDAVSPVQPSLEEDAVADARELAEEQRNGSRRRSRQLGAGKRTRSRSSSGVMVKSGAELSLDAVQKQTRICSSKSNPFCGTLTNKVSFKNSGKSKSPTSSSVFNNITLSLPGKSGGDGEQSWFALGTGACPAPVTLETLLRMFVSSEAVEAEKEQLVKQLTFGRLPECFCFHIQRTAFENGSAFKRNDIVLFPTLLNMDSYAYNRQLGKRMVVTPAGSELKPASTPSVAASPIITSPPGTEVDEEAAFAASWRNNPGENYNNNYVLRAVVVHMGAMNSGHYVTYRREPENPLSSSPPSSCGSSKWYYTSDTLVREVPLDEVLKTNPYMLFYEKIHTTSLDFIQKSPDVID